MSRPTRARGLKCRDQRETNARDRSRPTRARGLKYDAQAWEIIFAGVAPHAGAWIEIAIDWTGAKLLRRRAPRGRVD